MEPITTTAPQLSNPTPPDPADLVPLRLVPVAVFGAGCHTHCPESDCPDGSYGLMDAVEAWSDCNRAEGHTYRVDDTDPKYRRPGDTVEVFVRREDLPWFQRRFDAETFASPGPIATPASPIDTMKEGNSGTQ